MVQTSLVTLQGQLVLLLLVGLIARRVGIFDTSAKRLLTDLVIYITLPASIILSFRIEFTRELLSTFLLILGIAAALQVFAYILSRIFFRSREEARRKVLRYGLLVANSGFLGLPIAGEVFGPVGYMYASIFLIPMRVVMWSGGLAIFNTEVQSKKELVLKVVLHPCMIAVYIGFFFLFTDLALPTAIDTTLRSLGGMTTGLSMMLIGSLFGEMEREHLKVDSDLFIFSTLRLVVLPLLALLLSKLLGASTLIDGVSVVMIGMPGGSTTAILAAKYGGDTVYASKLVLLSTALSLITIPLWVLVL